MLDSETLAPVTCTLPCIIPVATIFMKIEISFKDITISLPVTSCVIFPILSNFKHILASFFYVPSDFLYIKNCSVVYFPRWLSGD